MKHTSKTIIGTIAGDVIGSVYEHNNIKTTEFDLFNPECKFTDDTVLTIAVADCILHKKPFAKTLAEYAKNYPDRGYESRFSEWIHTQSFLPYNSYGNGSAMRVSSIGFAYNNLERVLKAAKLSAEITHDHPEGIKGAQAVATAIFLAKIGKSKQEIRSFIKSTFIYAMDSKLDDIRSTYTFSDTCQNTVPQAITAFLESSDYEDAIRLAISIGGDSDTIACMTGGIAAAYYKEIPEEIIDFVVSKLPDEFIEIIDEFEEEMCTY